MKEELLTASEKNYTGRSRPASEKNHTGRSRPAFEEIYLNLAFTLAKRSTCQRLQVGTVITSSDFRKVLAVGYNGNASGLPNCCENPNEPGNCGCLHSEENAAINCDSPRSIKKFVFVTHHPCRACAKRLINLGNVQKIFYGKDYRSTSSQEILNSVGIPIIKLETPFLYENLI